MQLHDALVLEALLNSESGTELYAFDPPHQDWDEIALQDSLHMHSINEKRWLEWLVLENMGVPSYSKGPSHCSSSSYVTKKGWFRELGAKWNINLEGILGANDLVGLWHVAWCFYSEWGEGRAASWPQLTPCNKVLSFISFSEINHSTCSISLLHWHAFLAFNSSNIIDAVQLQHRFHSNPLRILQDLTSLSSSTMAEAMQWLL